MRSRSPAPGASRSGCGLCGVPDPSGGDGRGGPAHGDQHPRRPKGGVLAGLTGPSPFPCARLGDPLRARAWPRAGTGARPLLRRALPPAARFQPAHPSACADRERPEGWLAERTVIAPPAPGHGEGAPIIGDRSRPPAGNPSRGLRHRSPADSIQCSRACPGSPAPARTDRPSGGAGPDLRLCRPAAPGPHPPGRAGALCAVPPPG